MAPCPLHPNLSPCDQPFHHAVSQVVFEAQVFVKCVFFSSTPGYRVADINTLLIAIVASPIVGVAVRRNLAPCLDVWVSAISPSAVCCWSCCYFTVSVGFAYVLGDLAFARFILRSLCLDNPARLFFFSRDLILQAGGLNTVIFATFF